MSTIKYYTDLEQSRKLVEILPLESADMYIGNYVGKSGKVDGTNIHYYPKGESFGAPEIINAWSLMALIDIIENIDKLQKVEVSFTHNGGKYWVDIHFDEFGSFCQDHELYNSKVDALIAMIWKFKNRGLL